MEELARLHAVVEGYVQGVGFRVFVSNTAEQLGLSGWVRNRWNGDVEVVAEGQRSALDSLITALYKGPRSSHVTKVATEWLLASGEFSGFHIRPTV
jgi:acylphosphatase